MIKFWKYLGDHPEFGLLAFIKIFTIESIVKYQDELSVVAILFADLGKIAAGLLAIFTLIAVFVKNIIQLYKKFK
jgi:hypothetical protein